MKTCTICKLEKPEEEFGKHAQKKDGLSSWCFVCTREKANKRNSRPENRKKKKAYDKKRNAKPEVREMHQKQNRKRYVENTESIKQNVRNWQKQNPKRTLQNKKNNKYKRRAAINGSTLTAVELRAWEDAQPKLCSYCGIACENGYQIDHIDPLSKGGTHTLDNLTISCPTCNRKKSDSFLIVWYAKQLNT